MIGITVAELAERVKEAQGRIADYLAEWREAGWVECVDERWHLTAAGLEVAWPLRDMRGLGDDEPGEVKRLKRASDKTLKGPA